LHGEVSIDLKMESIGVTYKLTKKSALGASGNALVHAVSRVVNNGNAIIKPTGRDDLLMQSS
jgi:hypothetical protein